MKDNKKVTKQTPIRLTESDIENIVKRTIKEAGSEMGDAYYEKDYDPTPRERQLRDTNVWGDDESGKKSRYRRKNPQQQIKKYSETYGLENTLERLIRQYGEDEVLDKLELALQTNREFESL